MAEWSIAAVLKTVELRGSWGSNPYLSAERIESPVIEILQDFFGICTNYCTIQKTEISFF